MAAYNYFNGLFNSISTKGSNNLYASFGELSSIRTGSYKKLLNKYYNGDSDSSNKAGNVLKDVSQTDKSLTKVKSSSDSLSEAATKLYTSGSDSVFKSDKESAITDAVKSFASSYNSLLSNADNSTTASVVKSAGNLVSDVKTYSKSLANVGITLDDKGKMSVDEDKLSKASKDELKDLFSGTNSLAFKVGAKASMLSSAATNASNSLYGSNGSFSNYNLGSSFDAYL